MPEPVGPVTSTRPFFSIANFFSTGGSPSSSPVSTLLGMSRKTAEMPFFWLKKFARKRAKPGILVAEIDVAGFLEVFDLLLRRDLVNERLEVVVFQRRHIHADQFAVDAEHGGIAGGEVKVRGALLLHEFEK